MTREIAIVALSFCLGFQFQHVPPQKANVVMLSTVATATVLNV